MSPYIFVGFSIVFGICGQLLLKSGMNRIGQTGGGRPFLLNILTSWRVLGGMITYAISVIFWMLALSYFELSYVYPFASLTYIGIIVGSYIVFRERITVMRFVGVAVIISGVFIISQS